VEAEVIRPRRELAPLARHYKCCLMRR
jgi:hypothetical protein